jgi:4-hydroxymandelate oxidase
MEFKEVLENARKCMGKCKACPICNGIACKNMIPGPGAKGVGDTAIRNYEKWQEIRVVMDTLCQKKPADTSLELFGKKFKYPFFAGPVGAVAMHYSDKYNDLTYNADLVPGCAEAGIAAFTGDGSDPAVMVGATKAVAENGGFGVPTVKPWNKEQIEEKMALINASNAFAVAMDIDAAGLPFLKKIVPPAGSKSVEEMKEIIQLAKGKPFIIKGIMSVKGALKAKEAGASGIVVSNHGGRVLDQSPATAEVLSEIVEAVKGDVKIFVDGGIRTGIDVFKALALGADAVLIARPYVVATYGGGKEGIIAYTNKIGAELADAMEMCGAATLKDITKEMIYK